MFGDNHTPAWALITNLATRQRTALWVSVLVGGWGWEIPSFKCEWNKSVKENNQFHEQFHAINNIDLTYSWLWYERGHAGVWMSARGQPEWVWHQKYLALKGAFLPVCQTEQGLNRSFYWSWPKQQRCQHAQRPHSHAVRAIMNNENDQAYLNGKLNPHCELVLKWAVSQRLEDYDHYFVLLDYPYFGPVNCYPQHILRIQLVRNNNEWQFQ